MSRNEPTTRTRILETAIGLLEAGGGAEVRMTDIAHHAQVSRQAVYLHFGSRADLRIAATHHVDASLDLEARLKAFRTASSVIERVALYVEFWGRYLPLVHGVASALIAMCESDAAAAAAWDERDAALKDGCAGTVDQLIEDDSLAPCWDRKTAIALTAARRGLVTTRGAPFSKLGVGLEIAHNLIVALTFAVSCEHLWRLLPVGRYPVGILVDGVDRSRQVLPVNAVEYR